MDVPHFPQTYVERDVRALINLKDLRSFQQFLILLAGRIGQVVNYSALSNDVGISGTTTKNWISVLEASFVVKELSPYFENIGKRGKDCKRKKIQADGMFYTNLPIP